MYIYIYIHTCVCVYIYIYIYIYIEVAGGLSASIFTSADQNLWQQMHVRTSKHTVCLTRNMYSSIDGVCGHGRVSITHRQICVCYMYLIYVHT